MDGNDITSTYRAPRLDSALAGERCRYFLCGLTKDRIKGSGPIEAGTLRSRRAVFRGCVSLRQWIDAVDVVGVGNLFDGLDLLQILDARMTR